jgi:hypothetical protein
MGRKYLNRSLGNRLINLELDASGSAQGTVADLCEDCNEPSGSIKGGMFVD